MTYDFNYALKTDAAELVLSPGCKTEIRGVFTNLRVDRKTIPEGINAYDIRHNDSGAPVTIEPKVRVDHLGTFFTTKEVKMTHDKGDKPWRGMGSYSFNIGDPYEILGLKKPYDIITAISEELNRLEDNPKVTIDPKHIAMVFNHDSLPVELYTLLYRDADDANHLHIIEVRFKEYTENGFVDFHLDRWIVVGAQTLYERNKSYVSFMEAPENGH